MAHAKNLIEVSLTLDSKVPGTPESPLPRLRNAPKGPIPTVMVKILSAKANLTEDDFCIAERVELGIDQFLGDTAIVSIVASVEHDDGCECGLDPVLLSFKFEGEADPVRKFWEEVSRFKGFVFVLSTREFEARAIVAEPTGLITYKQLTPRQIH